MWKEELKELQKKNKLTQQELADQLGLEVRQIKRYESGESTISRNIELAVKYLLLHGEEPSHKLRIDCLLLVLP